MATTNARAPRIVVLNGRDSAHPDGGGSERYVEYVAAGLGHRGFDVTLFCARPDGAPATETRDGYRVLRRGGRLTVYLWGALLLIVGRLRRPDLIIEVHNGVPFLATLYARRPVIVLVHHVHREQWPIAVGPILGRVGWWLESRVAPRVNRGLPYVAVSEHTRSDLVRLGVPAESIRVIHCGTTPRPADVPKARRAADPTICVLSRLVPHKRVELVLEAATALRVDHPTLRVQIVGEGWWRERLEAAAVALGGTVEFTGWVDEATKHELLARAWVHAIASIKEGWGLSVVEAGTHSVPTVAFRGTGGLEESVVDGRTGVLAHDLADFTAALRALIEDPSLRDRLGAEAERHAARFTWAATVDAFATMAEQVLAESRVSGCRRRPVVGRPEAASRS